MIDRSDLWQAAADALGRLGLNRWKVRYADEEPETVFDHAPAPGTAFNLRFDLVTDDGRFLNQRLLLPSEHAIGGPATREWITATLLNRIRADHVRAAR